MDRNSGLPKFKLKRVRLKLVRESQRLWKNPLTEVEALTCEREYREYLALCKREPSLRHEPSRKADYMWHMHILFMEKYEKDCMAYLGRMLYHRPKTTPLGTKTRTLRN
jgi:hypothetical protein